MTKTWAAKDPDEVLKYTYDWSLDLAEGETLLPDPDSTFDTVTAAGTTVDSVEYGPDFVSVVISGGTEGMEAVFMSRVKTSEDQTLEDTIILPVRTTVVPVAYPGGYAEPTPANLICAYPEFATVSPVTIQSYLTRAAGWVTTSWHEIDFGHARMALAAHLMTLNGLGSSAQSASVRDGSGDFKSMGIGSLKLERFDKGKTVSAAGANWDSTRYGTEFRAMLRRNKGGPRVAGYSGPAHRDYGDNFGPWTA